MRTRLTVRLCVCAILLSGSAVRAQAPDPSREARGVVDAFFATTNSARWTEAVAFLDLPSFEKHFRQTVNRARSDLPRPLPTVEETMARDSAMPRAVAEWQVARDREHAKKHRLQFHDFSRQFAGVTSFRTLQALTPAEAAARSLEAQDPATGLRKWLAEANCRRHYVAADTARLFTGFRRKTVGVAIVDDSTAYVLATDSSRNMDPDPDPSYVPTPDLVRVVRTTLGWRISHAQDLLSGSTYMAMSCQSGDG